MSEQFECVNCGTSFDDKDKFEDIPENFNPTNDLDLDEDDVICKDCLKDYQTQVNRMAVSGSDAVPPHTTE